MTTYISMLRGINVGGKKRISMEELKGLYESLGYKDVQTFIQSGNVMFRSEDAPEASMEKAIRDKIKEALDLDVKVILRTEDEFKAIIEKNPFKKEDPGNLHVTFLSDHPAKKPVEEIEKIKDKGERFFLSGRDIYLFLPNGYGRTKLSNDLFEKKLGVCATTRNWATVNALLDKAKWLPLSSGPL